MSLTRSAKVEKKAERRVAPLMLDNNKISIQDLIKKRKAEVVETFVGEIEIKGNCQEKRGNQLLTLREQ